MQWAQNPSVIPWRGAKRECPEIKDSVGRLALAIVEMSNGSGERTTTTQETRLLLDVSKPASQNVRCMLTPASAQSEV